MYSVKNAQNNLFPSLNDNGVLTHKLIKQTYISINMTVVANTHPNTISQIIVFVS